MTRQELVDICLTFPAAYEDYPFGADSSWCVIRHHTSRKGFAHIYERNNRLCVNLKCVPFEADLLRQMFEDVTPAYHMNKVHWNTVKLGGDVSDEELRRMIERSYNFIRPKINRKL